MTQIEQVASKIVVLHGMRNVHIDQVLADVCIMINCVNVRINELYTDMCYVSGKGIQIDNSISDWSMWVRANNNTKPTLDGLKGVSVVMTTRGCAHHYTTDTVDMFLSTGILDTLDPWSFVNMVAIHEPTLHAVSA